MQLLIFSFLHLQMKFWALSNPNPFGLVGSNGLFDIWLLRNQVVKPFYPYSLRSLVGSNGLGPSTSRLSGVCSNQLSYEPVLVEVIGFEPMTPCLQGRCSTSWAIPPSTFFRALLPFLAKINAPPYRKALLLKTNKKETVYSPYRLELVKRLSARLTVLPKRRWSSRTFRYGYLVTTSPQSSGLIKPFRT